ncbi:uncharacterized protein BT62DRAFT_933607 [Guyanagaster necrorhizus]|uniref:MYND-type domain-containing protein n=1 Tax=Guyanagaster necrorhizus TaxID=856835 RepID=A0A9P7VQ78_9AGAR|nr:uncharacterized protein BT62DRAFT_933607 [Guyanagaster necrorhizus MCA 3950]KAG7444582.1 hypothetical protein BT62DRAFT_933607 [Guyanagaster necrorhizus MCA 3950]
MSTGWHLYFQAETLYGRGEFDRAFERYQKAIKKIVKDELVTMTLPILNNPLHEYTLPTETLGAAWSSFISYFKDPALGKTKDNALCAYMLLYSYRPTSTIEDHPRFFTDKAQLYLKGMQITAGLTLGLLAWDDDDRAISMRRFREALELAAAHPPYYDLANASQPWERFVCTDVKDARDNLAVVFENDPEKAQLLAIYGVGDGHPWREVLGVGYVRYGTDGEITFERNMVVTLDECVACGKRDVKLRPCKHCEKVAYCSGGCQRMHWRMHQPDCIPP